MLQFLALPSERYPYCARVGLASCEACGVVPDSPRGGVGTHDAAGGGSFVKVTMLQ